ncbi:MAG: hypothetical protein V1926_03020 [Candidatus Peregrinibacteria bacterium]
MPANHLEQLVAEWYQLQGFFVRRNVQVGKRPQGGYECELDVVAFHPVLKHLVHVEPSLDCDTWQRREERYRKKFDAGRRHIPSLFAGFNLPTEFEQIALFVYGGGKRTTLAGGRVMFIKDFMQEILNSIRTRKVGSAAIPEDYPLLRSLQFAAQYWPLN